MSHNSVICLATTVVQADQIVERLKAASFSPGNISVLCPDIDSACDLAYERDTKAPKGAVVGAATGGIIGSALGWLIGIGVLAIPGSSLFIAAGPIMAALGGAALGFAAGGIAGGLIGLGIPELNAEGMEGRIKEGNILISVLTENCEEITLAKDSILQSQHSEQLHKGDPGRVTHNPV